MRTSASWQMFEAGTASMVLAMGETVLPDVLTRLFVGDVDGAGLTGGFVLPTGTVTFLMTDIEGSTRAWERRPGALLCGGEAALDSALRAAQRAVARQVPAADELVQTATHFMSLIRGGPVDRVPARLQRVEPWLAARDSISSGDAAAAAAAAESLVAGGSTRQAMACAIRGQLHEDPDDWHEALRLAGEHGLRLIAVDTLEALGAAAAATESAAEAVRLFDAAERLRRETGYRWRFRVEQERHDIAWTTAREELGNDTDAAWHEGLSLDLADAVEYARRARGERGRPRHGWDSLTPTEQQVADLVAEGLTNPEAAKRLMMGRGTVKTHLEHIYAKTGLRNRAELAATITARRHDQP